METLTNMSAVVKLTTETEAPESLDPLDGLDKTCAGAAAVFGLLAVTLLVNNILHKQHVPVPEAIATVCVGLIGGALALVFPAINSHTIQQFENLSARDFMMVFLAPIIFAEGYGLKSRQFFQNITRILLNAFVGTVLSAIVVACFIYYLPPLTGLASKYHFTFAECFTFGVLVSATDPVTTLAIFKEQNMVEHGLSHLYYSVLGESILNDAVAITLFEGCAKLVEDGHSYLDGAAIGNLAGDFCIAWFGSVALGVAAGLVAALCLKFARLGNFSDEHHFHFNVPEMGIVLVLAYLPFLIATATDILSPIVAILFAGITMRHYAHYNMTIMTRQVFLPTIELIANLFETYAFLLLGVGVFLLTNDLSAPLIIWAIVAALIGRAVFVYPNAYVVNKLSKCQPLTVRETHVVWFAGLRGAVAFVCALRFPENEESKNRNVFLCTVMVMVFLSLLCLGWPTAWVLKKLNIKAPENGLSEASRLQSCLENSACCLSLSSCMQKFFMAPDARDERLSNVKLSRARSSAASRAVHGVEAEPENEERPSLATGLGPWGNERLSALSQRLSATGQRPSAARTICDP